MSEDLTEAEQNGLLVAFLGAEDDCAHNLAPLFAEVHTIVTARMADAWDEGFTAGFYDPLAASSSHDASESARINPYRATEEAS